MAFRPGLRTDDEASVIDDDMITKALVEAGGMDHEFTSNVTFQLPEIIAKAPTISMSFKNILEIDNLQGFHALTKLCLDNNIINKIQKLDHLSNLTWLDLSFNNIEQIEGLNNLTKLTDLSLFNNKIEKIEGLECCQKIQCLSLGNNRITSLENVKELRGFEGLHLVNLEGNPISKQQDYKYLVLAYLPYLKYLDFALVEEEERTAAQEQFSDDVTDMQENERLQAEEIARLSKQREITKELDAANLEVAESLFDEMFDEDNEHPKLLRMPDVDDAVADYKSMYKEAAELLKNEGRVKDQQKREEHAIFLKAVQAVEKYHSARAVELIEQFGKKKKRVYSELSKREHVDQDDLKDLKSELNHLEEELMDLEIQQVEQFDDLSREFETRYGEMTTCSLDLLARFFRTVEELEERYNNRVLEIATELLEQAQKEELPEETSEELSSLLVDRDTCMNAISTSHDTHVGRLLKREDEVNAREKERAKKLLDSAREKESNRNRKRITEIKEFLERNYSNMNELIKTATDDFDDGYDG